MAVINLDWGGAQTRGGGAGAGVYLTIQKQLHFQGQLPVDCCCEGTVTWHNIKPPLQPSTGACLFSAILVFLTSQPTLGALH